MSGRGDLLSYLQKKPAVKASPNGIDNQPENKKADVSNSKKRMRMEQFPRSVETEQKRSRPMRSCVLAAQSHKAIERDSDADAIKLFKGSKRKAHTHGSVSDQIYEATGSYPDCRKQEHVHLVSRFGDKDIKSPAACPKKTNDISAPAIEENASKCTKHKKSEDNRVSLPRRLTLKRSPLKKDLRPLEDAGRSTSCRDGDGLKKSKIVFNLRQEAKEAAKENLRLLGGKETHPFFVRRKAHVSHGVNSQVEPCLQGPKISVPVLAPCAPFHVTQDNQVPIAQLDWRRWSVGDDLLQQTISFDLQEIYRCSEHPLDGIQTCERIVHSSDIRKNLSSTDMDSFNGLPKYSTDSEEINKLLDVLCRYLEKHTESPMHDLPTGPLKESSNHILVQDLEERYNAYYYQRSHVGDFKQAMPGDNLLWTDKYRPECSGEVCGNKDSVMAISEWLHSWGDDMCSSQNGKQNRNTDNDSGEDWDSFQDASEDSSNALRRNSVQNVLLISGPVGCGKSASLYACANEQGFDVIEINSSECRNGASVKQKFGEAVESYSLSQRRTEEMKAQESKIAFECLFLQKEEKKENNSSSLKARTCRVASSNAEPVHTTKQKHIDGKDEHLSNRNRRKALILFEDVDTLFDEDRGFMTTLLQLAEVSKRPIVLTSNRRDPCLPRLLNNLAVEFNHPSEKELISHLFMVCIAESFFICPSLIEHVIRCCNKDLRKIMLLLQFWCQGNKYSFQDGQICQNYSSALFELDAEHSVIPFVIPWSFPCKLSQTISMELSKALNFKEKMCFNSAHLETECSEGNKIASQSEETKLLTTAEKKALMLERACIENDELHTFSAVRVDDSRDNTFHHFSSCSQELHVRRSKHIIASDSDDMTPSETSAAIPESQKEVAETQFSVDSQILADKSFIPFGSPSLTDFKERVESGQEVADTQFSQVSERKIDDSEPIGSKMVMDITEGVESEQEIAETQFSVEPQGSLDNCDLPTDSSTLVHFKHGIESNKQIFRRLKKSEDCNLLETSSLLNVSIVPESSFVPETILDDNDEYKGEGSQELNKICLPGKEKPASTMEGNKVEQANGDGVGEDIMMLKTFSDRKYNKNSPLEKETIGRNVGLKEINVLKQDINRRCMLFRHEVSSLMDECSRVDFNAGDVKRKGLGEDPVQETWQRMFDSHENFKSLLSPDCHDMLQTIDLASRMADIFSLSDLLLNSLSPQKSYSNTFNPMLDPYGVGDSSSIFSSEELSEITSDYAQHGFYLVAKLCYEIGSRLGNVDNFDLRREILAASRGSLATGNLILEERDKNLSEARVTLNKPSVIDYYSERQINETRLSNALESVVPSKSTFSSKSLAFHEYTSFLGKICKLEEFRLKHSATSKRRARGFRHYLKSSLLSFSEDSVSMLMKHSDFGFEETCERRLFPFKD